MVNYSSEEVMVLMEKPSVSESPSGRAPGRAPDGILRRQKIAAAEKYFHGSPDFFWDFSEFIGEGARAGEAQGAHKPGRRRLPWPRLGGLWGPWWPRALILRFLDLLQFQKKSFWKFRSVWTPFKILL